MEHSPLRDQSHGGPGHAKNESISDYIAYYGNDNWRNSRPLSYIPSHDDTIEHFSQSPARPGAQDSLLVRSLSTERYPLAANGVPMEGGRLRSTSTGSQGGPLSPNLTRSPSETATQAFPLNDIDYESSAAAVAQELSNLQAIRRMSMNVDAADPDLPSFALGHGVPAKPPSPGADEDDDARLYWVPARLHPELAPKDYRSFVEDRVDRIRRRAGSDASVQEEGLERTRSTGGLQRQKSRLSRTINSGVGYQDGAEILERKKSQSSKSLLDQSETTLQELETLVNDPAQIVRSFDNGSSASNGGPHSEADLPMPPPSLGLGLKRSTRTNYRNTSLRKGERISAGRRVPGRLSDDGARDSAIAGMQPTEPEPLPGRMLARSNTEPTSPMEDSHASAAIPSQQTLQHAASMDTLQQSFQDTSLQTSKPSTPGAFHSRIASNGRTTASIPARAIPQIIETPPPPNDETSPPAPSPYGAIPQRSSSHEYSRNDQAQNTFGDRPTPRPMYTKTSSFNRTLDDMASKPAMMIGANTRTDNVTFIPTMTESKPEKPEKRSDRKLRDRKDGDSGTRKTSWNWLLKGEDKEKKEKEKVEKEAAKKHGKLVKVHSEKDIVRLDVLQTASEEHKTRESLVLSREDIRFDEERKKETNRKSGGSEGKKEKEGGLFSSIFGGKKKGEKEAAKQNKANAERTLTPEPLSRLLRADIDYNWTRFSILEERAIYRMAHIKLANPRRALYSQVLLSNFMYSYLAKVQQMHPQIQIPQFVQQKQSQQSQQQMQQQQMQQQQEQHQQQQYQQHMQAQQEQQMDLQNPNDEFAQWQRYQEHDRKPSYNNPDDMYNNGGSNGNPQSSSPSSTQSFSSSSPASAYAQPQYQQHQPAPNVAAMSPHSFPNEHAAYIDYENPDHQQQQQPDPWSYDHYDNLNGGGGGGGSVMKGEYVHNGGTGLEQDTRLQQQQQQHRQNQQQHQQQHHQHHQHQQQQQQQQVQQQVHKGNYWDQRNQRDRRYEQQGMFGRTAPPDQGGGGGSGGGGGEGAGRREGGDEMW